MRILCSDAVDEKLHHADVHTKEVEATIRLSLFIRMSRIKDKHKAGNRFLHADG